MPAREVGVVDPARGSGPVVGGPEKQPQGYYQRHMSNCELRFRHCWRSRQVVRCACLSGVSHGRNAQVAFSPEGKVTSRFFLGVIPFSGRLRPVRAAIRLPGPLRRKSVTKEPTTDLLLGKAMKAVGALRKYQLMTNA